MVKTVKSNDGRKKKRYTKTQSKPSSSTIRKGTSVEVTSKDKSGFCVRWYVGTVLTIILANNEEKVEFYRIKFKTANNEKSLPLIKNVPRDFVRPLPPRVDNDDVEFEVEDVVDAFYEYGWHVGTVVNVLDHNKKKYAVKIKYLNDEVLEFETSKMRVHSDWVDSCWKFPPEKPPKDKEELADKSSTHTPIVSDAPRSAPTAMTGFVDSTLSDAPTAGFTTPSKRPPTNEICEFGDVNSQHIGQPMLHYKRKKCVSKGSKESKEPVCVKETSTSGPQEETIPAPTPAPTETSRDGNSNSQHIGKKYERKLKGILWPFKKKMNELWVKYEGDEFYQKLSQKPHFSPLKNFPRDKRELMALGQMQKFVEVVRRYRKFKLSDPAHIIEDLKTVDDLQKHGFDMNAMKARLEDLRDRKVEIDRLLGEGEKIKEDIEKHKVENEAIGAHINKFQEKLEEITTTRKKMESETKRLKSELCYVRYEISKEKLRIVKLDKPDFSPLEGFEEDKERLAAVCRDIYSDVIGKIKLINSSDISIDMLADSLRKVEELRRYGFDLTHIKAHLEKLQECDKKKKDLDKHNMDLLDVEAEVKELERKRDVRVKAKEKKDEEIIKLEAKSYYVDYKTVEVERDFDKLVDSPLN